MLAILSSDEKLEVEVLHEENGEANGNTSALVPILVPGLLELLEVRLLPVHLEGSSSAVEANVGSLNLVEVGAVVGRSWRMDREGPVDHARGGVGVVVVSGLDAVG